MYLPLKNGGYSSHRYVSKNWRVSKRPFLWSSYGRLANPGQVARLFASFFWLKNPMVAFSNFGIFRKDTFWLLWAENLRWNHVKNLKGASYTKGAQGIFDIIDKNANKQTRFVPYCNRESCGWVHDGILVSWLFIIPI